MRSKILLALPLSLIGASSLAGTPAAVTTTPVVMDEIVVSATKTEETRKDVANSVITIDSEDIQASPASSIGRLLGQEKGIDWRTRGNYGGAAEEIHIRGMQGDETQVLINGVSLNSPSFGSADMGRIPMNAAANIEIVKGSGSLLYGSGAMAGTVSIETKDPTREAADLVIGAGYGSNHAYGISFENGMYMLENFGYYLTAGRRSTEGFRDNSDLSHKDASLKLVYDRGDRLRLSLYGDIIDRNYGVPGIKPPAGTGSFALNGVPFYNADSANLLNSGADTDSHLVLKSSSHITDWLQVTLQADYSELENFNLSRYNANGFLHLAGEGLKTWVNNDVGKVEGHAQITPCQGVNLLAGADYQNHSWGTRSIDLDTGGLNKPTGSNNKANLFSRGVYTELQYRPHRLIKVLAGLRQENHSTFGSETLPLYGAVLNPLPDTALKFTRGKHFKAPTPNDLYWPEDDFVRGNPNLGPQTGWHTDVTIEQSLMDDSMFLSVSYFDWTVDGKITWAENPSFPGPWGNKWTPTNLNSSKGNGWEFGLRLKPASSLELSFNYTRSSATDITPTVRRQAQYIPKNSFAGSMTYRSEQGFTGTIQTNHTDERHFYRSTTDTVPTDTLDSYYTVDVRAEQRIWDSWLLSLEGTNIFNTEYDTYVGSFTDSAGATVYGRYPGAGASWFVKVAYEY